jgi:hemoglobin
MNTQNEGGAIVPPIAPQNPHFARIGGAMRVACIVDAFYRNMDKLPEATAIRALHPDDLRTSRDVLYKYLVGWLGGPPLYVAERGSPRLRQKHLPFAIGDAERDAWMLCMRLALEEYLDDAQLRGELLQAFVRTANSLRNR